MADAVVEEWLSHPMAHDLLDIQGLHRSLPIYQVSRPTDDETRRLISDFADQIRSTFGDGQGIEIYNHKNRIILRLPEVLQLRAYTGSSWLDFQSLRSRSQLDVEALDMIEVHRLVRTFFNENGFLPKDWERETQPDRLHLARGIGADANQTHSGIGAVNTVLIYKRYLNGIPWIGPGGQISATIGGGEVVMFDRPWRTVNNELGEEASLQGVENALTAVVNRLGRRFGGTVPTGVFTFERIELGYYSGSRHDEQNFLQPAYQVFLRTKGQAATGIVEVVPALTRTYEVFGPSIASSSSGRRT